MLPNLLIIGAAKSGTTSLHRYLGQHPEIHMAQPGPDPRLHGANDANPKEMRFFWREDWRQHLRWYESHFEVEEPIRGEATPAYTAWPHHAGVPERIRDVVPNVRLIYVVRDPIDRLVAHWVQAQVDGDDHALAARLAQPNWQDDPIVCPSRYATQLYRYLACFEADQILLVDQQQLRYDRHATLSEVFSFLGVDDGFWCDAFEREENTRAEKRALTRAGKPLFTRMLDPAGRRLAPRTWARSRPRVRRYLSRPVPPAGDLSTHLRTKLESLLRPEVDELRRMTSRDFASWSL